MKKNPYGLGLTHQFVVEFFDKDGDIQMSFSKVSGLEIELEFESFGTIEVPAESNFGNLVLERGVGGVNQLNKWFAEVLDDCYVKKDGSIKLVDVKGKTIRTWRIEKALPVKWSGPSLNASGQEVAVEVVELMCEGIVLKA